ncbi:SpoIIE family protein phosphatase [Streptacidiphilus sp. PB12-B1b]|uniref:PP2C family protein-serine/threonine phosphatase n=1 Tax=Streptacidiphilus sp. PB12-B1b TaxID=2705012 RepID=UPI0015F8728A|nr:SpoIIE family protein phosphatase [Streptacidiphilus sp. PB12-B1b]QMU77705.1 SpoIIE family protein phosphatase [Streptacidiphilus sp. PB12-B1b]
MARRRDPAGIRRSARSTGALILIPLALVALIAIGDIFSPADIHLGPLLVVAPAITASFAGPRLTAAIGALSVATLMVIGVERGVFTTENIQVQIASLTAISAFVVVFNHLHERSRSELVRVRRVSEAAQRVLQRPLPPSVGPLRVASSYRAVAADARVGGDLFAAARTGTSTRLIIGDVRGKGLETLGDTALLLGAFRAAAHQQAPLPTLAAYLEGSVSWGLAEITGDGGHDAEGMEVGEGFVTALIVDIPDDEPRLTVINCGHPPPVLLHRGRATTLDVCQPAPPLGLGSLADPAYSATDFGFEEGDLLLLYTDGISEARDAHGVFYPLASRLARLGEGSDPAGLLAGINQDLDDYVGGPLLDDAAMIAVARDQPAPAPGPLPA